MRETQPEGKGFSAELGDALRRVRQQAGREAVAATVAWRPAWDLKETPDETVVLVDLPGVEEDAIEVRLEDGVLIVSGARDFDHDYDDAEDFTHLERPFGPFACRIPVVREADLNGATAKYKRGVLRVRLPHPSHASRLAYRIDLG